VAKLGDRIKHAWNAFTTPTNDDPSRAGERGEYWSMWGRPDRPQLYITNERSIISSIYTRMSIDCASVDIRHVRTDDQDRYLEDIDSGLNNCLTLEANIDQAARHFRQDVMMSLFDQGTVAIVPVDTTLNPMTTGGYDIQTMRVGQIMMWYPQFVRVSVYNEKTGLREEITLPKSMVAIVENPLYSVMNEPNSTLQRLIRKLSLLDTTDEQLSSGKLDLIIQLPYVIKSESRRQQAEQRRKDVEFQLKGSQYGIAYTDGTEKITQLNRPAENNLLSQVELLTNLLYVQLGLTPEVMNGTADEQAMLNYINRTIEPVVTAIVQAMKRTFLTKTARTQHQSIMFFRDPFKLIPLGGQGGIADIADKLARNEIMSSNELRQVLWLKPSKEPKADQLINSNMPQADTGLPPANGDATAFKDQVNAALAEADKALGNGNGAAPSG
jgi:Phage portal protein